ncbi:MAG: nucleotidyltransferase family protein [Erysipelotrichaceae bacterium]
MKICGIIVEYNPFTYGHLHHIEQARKLSGCDVLVAVMSGNFVQRGEVSIIDKWARAKCAVEHGVDLVIQLPYIYSNQSATQFAQGAVQALKLCIIDTLVFGSESNNLENLKEIASLNINIDHLKKQMKTGDSYASSYSLLQGQFPPNDILALAYLRALQDSDITPISILRTTDYHNVEVSGKISSATSIRNLLYQEKDTSEYCPMSFEYCHYNELYFNYLKTMMLTLDASYLESIFLVDEGLQNHLIASIKKSNTYPDFIQEAVNRRYSKARIQRVCMNILNHISKQEKQKLPPMDFIRPLAFNASGQQLLKHLRKQGVSIASCFAQMPIEYRKMEYKTTQLYVHPLDSQLQKKILERELQGPIIVK